MFCVDIAANWIFRFDLPIFAARTVLRLKVSAITAVIPLIFLIISVAQKRDNLFVVMSQISDICKESDVPSRITSPGSRAISTPLVYWSTELTSGHFWVTEVTDWVFSHWQTHKVAENRWQKIRWLKICGFFIFCQRPRISVLYIYPGFHRSWENLILIFVTEKYLSWTEGAVWRLDWRAELRVRDPYLVNELLWSLTGLQREKLSL